MREYREGFEAVTELTPDILCLSVTDKIMELPICEFFVIEKRTINEITRMLVIDRRAVIETLIKRGVVLDRRKAQSRLSKAEE
jgi:hypothetical protein